jgi:hypothetical protein
MNYGYVPTGGVLEMERLSTRFVQAVYLPRIYPAALPGENPPGMYAVALSRNGGHEVNDLGNTSH